ncbi:hypothetical protein FQ192_27790 [Pseudomonas sp. ANT_J12]|nr:hypothetical protein FQ192_27790 [Pseudomonas sp. ANT_J12]
MWRGSLLPLGCAAVANPDNSVRLKSEGAASQPSGSKLPRHRCARRYFCAVLLSQLGILNTQNDPP